MSYKLLRQQLLSQCQIVVHQRIASAQDAIRMAQDSANEEGKSSAGDKYETGRAMAQLEIEKASSQLAEANKLKQALEQIPVDENNSASHRTRPPAGALAEEDNSSQGETPDLPSPGRTRTPEPGNNMGSVVRPGSLVITNQGNYFISIAAGKLTVDNQSWFAISPASPLGAILVGKKEGDVVKMLAKEIVVERVG